MNAIIVSLRRSRFTALCLTFWFAVAVAPIHAQSGIVFMTAQINPLNPGLDSKLVRFDSGTQSFMTDTGGYHAFGGVTILNGEVLVADQLSDQIQRFDPDGTYLGPFASSIFPLFLESDSDDNVYANDETGAARRFNSAGAVTGTFAYGCCGLYGIDADASGNVYVVGNGYFDERYLYQFATDGTFLNSIDLVCCASDISIDEINQRLYLARGPFGIQIYDISGTVPVLAGAIVTPVNSVVYGVHYAAESGNILATDSGYLSGDPRGLEYSPLGTLIAEYRPTNAYFANDIITMVPEPGSMGLLSLAFAGFGLTRRQRRRCLSVVVRPLH